MLGEWIGVPAAARIMNLTPQGVRNLIDVGRIPAFNVGSKERMRYRIKVIDLEHYMEAQRVKPRLGGA